MKKLSKIKKIFNIILILILLYSIIQIVLPSKSLAISENGSETEDKVLMEVAETTLYDPDALGTLKSNIDDYKVSAEENTTVTNLINTILGILTAVGAVMAVVIIAMIGFGYVMGSAEEKAVNKEQLITLLVGAIVLIAGSQIVKLIYNVVIDW